LQGELQQLRALAAQLQQLVPDGAALAVVSRAADIAALGQAVAALDTQRSQLESQLEDLRLRSAELADSRDRLAEEVAAAEAEMAREVSELETTLESRMQTLHLPEVKSWSGRNVILLMRYGKVYAVDDRTGSTNAEHVVIHKETEREVVVSPKAAAGWRQSLPQDARALAEYLDLHPTNTHAVTVFVWADSFREFATLKEELLRRNQHYSLQPRKDEPDIRFVYSSSNFNVPVQ
jgi:hypothetical protein